jgi:phage baseplate assembly protein W
MARNTRTFSDLDINFLVNPATKDVARKYDEAAIKQSVRNLILTNHYERLFHPEIGSQITALLFEPFSPMMRLAMERAIINTINNYEPRVQLIAVDVTLNEDNHTVYVSITFRIINTERPLAVDITLKRTR